MIVDARTLPSGVLIEADICIVGAGAAGIAIAREFIGSPIRIILLESGGLEFDERTQALYDGENTGFPYYELDKLRTRYFGGTTNRWAGACRPLDPIDFEKRDAVPDSGWPFDKAHLDPFYERAHEVCQIGEYDYDPAKWGSNKHPLLPIDGDRAITAMFRTRALRFGQEYKEEIAEAENIRCFLWANVIEIETDEGGESVSALSLSTLDKKRFSARARIYVLATGGVENPRIMLESRSGHSGGIGNRHDLVGRYFMEHLSVPGSILLPSDPELNANFYGGVRQGGQTGFGYLTLSENTLRDEELVNIRAFFSRSSMKDREALLYTSEGVGSADTILESLRSGNREVDFAGHLRSVIGDIDDVAMFNYRKFFQPDRDDVPIFYLYNHIEQVPDRESRIVLGEDRDELGLRRVQLHWKFGDREKRTFRRANQIIAEELALAGIGRTREIRDNAYFDDERVFSSGAQGETGWPPGMRGGWHQMGATRMHENPKKGVVDPDCRVHDLSNLYVAGSSVFPTSGYTNPTLTIVALSLRLSDHLRKELA